MPESVRLHCGVRPQTRQRNRRHPGGRQSASADRHRHRENSQPAHALLRAHGSAWRAIRVPAVAASVFLMASTDVLARATALRREIERHNYAYYVLDQPTVFVVVFVWLFCVLLLFVVLF